MGRQQVDVITGHAQDISIKFRDSMMINTEVFPMLDTVSPSMKITRYKRGQQYQSASEERKPGTEIKTSIVERDQVQFDTIQYAASDFITREDLRDAGLPAHLSPPIDLAQDSLEKNAKDLDLGREIRVAAHVFADTWLDGVAGGTDVAGTWANAATSTFLDDFDVALVLLKKNGVPPEKLRLMLDFGTMQKLKRVDVIRDQLKHTSRDSLTADSLARILQIDRVIVGGAIQNTAQNKAGTDAFTGQYIWENNATKGSAFLYYYTGNPTKRSLNAGIQPRSMLDNKQHRITESYWDNKKKATFYDSMEETDELTVAEAAGYLWADTILT